MREHVVIFGLAAVAGAVASLFALRDRPRSAALRAVLALIVSGTWWSAGGVSMLVAPTPLAAAQAFLWLEPGLAVACSTLFYLSVVMADDRYTRSWWAWLLVGLDPLLSVVVLAVPALHTPFVTGRLVAEGRIELVPGPLMWVHAAWSGVLVVGGLLVMLVGQGQSVRGHRRRYATAVVGAGLPAIAALVVLATTRDAVLVPLAGSSGFLVGLVVWTVARRFGGREVSPVDVHQVVGALGDGLVVVDEADDVVLVNPAAHALVENWVGHGVDRRRLARTTAEVVTEVLADEGLVHLPSGTVVDVRHTPVLSRGRRTATVITVRDVTEVEALRAELADLAERDGLTGLRNRRYLDRVLPDLVARAATGEQPLVAAMIDVDRFKDVNDTYGHAAGDRVLVATAGALSARLRGDDVLVRFGGEEFLALLPGARLAEIAPRAEAWRAACAAVVAEGVPHAGRAGVATVSIGLAEVGPGDGVDDLLRAADAAMYSAKAAGRNRVQVHTGGMRGAHDTGTGTPTGGHPSADRAAAVGADPVGERRARA